MLRRFAGGHSGSTIQATTYVALSCSIAHKTTFVFIANRKKVELSRAMKYILPTRLSAASPEIAAEWDYDRNSTFLYPDILPIGSLKPVWWKCAKCQHSFECSAEKRIVRGAGCPACSVTAEAERSMRPHLSSEKGTGRKKNKKSSKKPVELLPAEIDSRNRPKHLPAHRSLLS